MLPKRRLPETGFQMTKSGFARAELGKIITRIERLEEEKKSISGDIREVYREASDLGFDTKIMRQVVRLRKLSPAERAEQQAVLDLYLSALRVA
jgi:uncharacterized protein (UPF0335 family)